MALYGGPHDGPSGPAYDVMQVCESGHVITGRAEDFPDHRKAFCPDCGAATIMECPECRKPIQGELRGTLFPTEKAPNNCHQCGSAFPWRQAAIASAIEIVQMQLEEEGADGAGSEELIKEVAVETPRTELAALKLKRLLSKLGPPAKQIAMDALSHVLAASARNTLGLP